jgi:hypothetical protein
MAIERIGSDVFESGCELIDVSMMSRPDTNWLFTDAAGHVHRWHEVGSSEPAQSYQPEWAYEVPTLRWVVDDRWIDEDGEERETGHSECVQCGGIALMGSRSAKTSSSDWQRGGQIAHDAAASESVAVESRVVVKFQMIVNGEIEMAPLLRA